MGKQLSGAEVASYERRRGQVMGRCWFALIGIVLSLVIAGCADTSAASDNDKRGVFYGGVFGGHAWP
jgi:hypothetical protein